MFADRHCRALTRAGHEVRLERAQSMMAEYRITTCTCTSPKLMYCFSGHEAPIALIEIDW